MSDNSSSGIGLAGATFIVFLVLKLTNVIDWSWWWVTSPLWISFGLTCLILLGVWIYCAIDDRRIERTYWSGYSARKRGGAR